MFFPGRAPRRPRAPAPASGAVRPRSVPPATGLSPVFPGLSPVKTGLRPVIAETGRRLSANVRRPPRPGGSPAPPPAVPFSASPGRPPERWLPWEMLPAPRPRLPRRTESVARIRNAVKPFISKRNERTVRETSAGGITPAQRDSGRASATPDGDGRRPVRRAAAPDRRTPAFAAQWRRRKEERAATCPASPGPGAAVRRPATHVFPLKEGRRKGGKRLHRPRRNAPDEGGAPRPTGRRRGGKGPAGSAILTAYGKINQRHRPPETKAAASGPPPRSRSVRAAATGAAGTRPRRPHDGKTPRGRQPKGPQGRNLPRPTGHSA